jgi:hypothetical protein
VEPSCEKDTQHSAFLMQVSRPCFGVAVGPPSSSPAIRIATGQVPGPQHRRSHFRVAQGRQLARAVVAVSATGECVPGRGVMSASRVSRNAAEESALRSNGLFALNIVWVELAQRRSLLEWCCLWRRGHEQYRRAEETGSNGDLGDGFLSNQRSPTLRRRATRLI